MLPDQAKGMLVPDRSRPGTLAPLEWLVANLRQRDSGDTELGTSVHENVERSREMLLRVCGRAAGAQDALVPGTTGGYDQVHVQPFVQQTLPQRDGPLFLTDDNRNNWRF